MNNRVFLELGKKFYDWHVDNKVVFEYAGHSKDLELEVERLIGLISYVKNKKKAFFKK